MPRNGAGTFSLVSNSWNPAVNGVTATAADYQQLVNDVAAAITQSLSVDGQTPMTGNLPMGNNRIIGLANASGVADAVPLGQVPSLLDQWVPLSGTPTFIDATSFRVAGDQTKILQVGRRIKTTNTSGTIYSTVKAAVYSSPNTTLTVANDSGSLDAGLSSVSYGLISALDSSLPPGRLLAVRKFDTVGTSVYIPSPGTKSVEVTVVGGGGGGGGGQATAAGQAAAGAGGGGGGWATKLIVSGFSGVTIAVGAAGAGASGANGTNGGNSSFGALVSASGGAGGSLGGAQATTFAGNLGFGTPGIGSNGDVNGVGGPGVFAIYGGNTPTGGSGGASYGGGGALWALATSGAAAQGNGCGGGGSSSTPSNGTNFGGAGGAGLVIVREYA